MDLRHAPERVRVLNVGAGLVGALRAFEPRRDVVGRNHRTGLVADTVNRRVHRGFEAVPGFEGPRSKGVGPVDMSLRHSIERHHACAEHHLSAVDECQPLPGTELERRPAGSRKASAEGSCRPSGITTSPPRSTATGAQACQIPDAPTIPGWEPGQHACIPMVEQALHRGHRHP